MKICVHIIKQNLSSARERNAQKETDFAEVFKNLAKYRSKNNFVGPLKLNRALKMVTRMSNFLQYRSLYLNVLHNYFNSPTNLFSCQ